jgi:hypothetical protein
MDLLQTAPTTQYIIADKLAKDAVVHAIVDRFISSNFPFESICIMLYGKKITASIKMVLYTFWGMHETQSLLQQ